MSRFFKALERAEQERALRRPTSPSGPTSEPEPAPPRPVVPSTVVPNPVGPVAPDSVPSRAPQSFFRSPRAAPVELDEHDAEPDEHDAEPAELEDHLVSLLMPTSFEAEQYRALRHLIEQRHRSDELRVIGVSSPDAAAGKTTTAINLAGALAQNPDARILVVDADLRAASMATYLGLDDHAPGLVNAILNPKLTLEAVVQRCPPFNLSVLTSGRRPSAPYEVLKSPRAGEILAEARENYDYVVVDTPPLVSVPDGRVIGNWIDGFLIVVAAHRTPRKLLEEALNLMEPEKIVGMIFNGDDHHVSRDTYSMRRPISRGGAHGR